MTQEKSIFVHAYPGSMKNIDRAFLYIHTLRYLKPAQIWYRMRRLIRRRWWQISGRQAPQSNYEYSFRGVFLYPGLFDIGSQGTWSESVADRCLRAEAVAEQRFNFLNQCVSFDEQPEWHNTELTRLWRFHLHYFDFVNDLIIWYASGKPNAAFQTFRRLASSWIDHNQRLEGDGWHPFTISVRLVNWINAMSVFERQLVDDQSFYQNLLSSLFGQAQFLSKDIEFDVRGNHILKNIKALLFVGLSFNGRGPQQWYRRALRLLELELIEQVLADGGHFERSPGYHLAVLKDCLEIAILVERVEGFSPRWLDDALLRMTEYLVAILPLNGQVPLLKDTTWDNDVLPIDLLNAAALYFREPTFKLSDDFGLYPFLLFGLSGWETFKEWPENRTPRGCVALRDTGYYVMRDDENDDFLILDFGKPCPDYLPAHAHADMFSYELTVGGQRVIVDSGVYEYTAGYWRDYFRSTRAHNTVEIEGADQSELWDSFRVARRARPGQGIWEETEGYALVQRTHNGYRRLSVPVIHRRTLVWQKACFWLVVDEVLGEGWIEAANYVHLHPDLTFNALSNSIWAIKGSHSHIWLTAFGHERCSLVKGQNEPICQGWYSERFGELLSNGVLSLYKEANLPFCYGYVISVHEPVQVKFANSLKGKIEIIVIHDNNSYNLKILSNRLSYNH